MATSTLSDSEPQEPGELPTLSGNTVALIDTLIAARSKQIELLTEMRDILTIADAISVDGKEILSASFEVPTHEQRKKWSALARARLPRYLCTNQGRNRLRRGSIGRVVNMVHLRDGTKLALREPIFLPGAPQAPFRFFLQKARVEFVQEGKYCNMSEQSPELKERAEQIKERMLAEKIDLQPCRLKSSKGEMMSASKPIVDSEELYTKLRDVCEDAGLFISDEADELLANACLAIEGSPESECNK